jgi:hypothetical protein
VLFFGRLLVLDEVFVLRTVTDTDRYPGLLDGPRTDDDGLYELLSFGSVLPRCDDRDSNGRRRASMGTKGLPMRSRAKMDERIAKKPLARNGTRTGFLLTADRKRSAGNEFSVADLESICKSTAEVLSTFRIAAISSGLK